MTGNLRVVVVLGLTVACLGFAANEVRDRVMVAGVEGAATVSRAQGGGAAPLAACVGLRDGDVVAAGAKAVKLSLLDLHSGNLVVVALSAGERVAVPAILQPRNESTWKKIATSLHAAIFGSGESRVELGGVRDGQSNDPAPAVAVETKDKKKSVLGSLSSDYGDKAFQNVLEGGGGDTKSLDEALGGVGGLATGGRGGSGGGGSSSAPGGGGGRSRVQRSISSRKMPETAPVRQAASAPAPVSDEAPSQVKADDEEERDDGFDDDDLGGGSSERPSLPPPPMPSPSDDALRGLAAAVFGRKSGGAVPLGLVAFRAAYLAPAAHHLQFTRGGAVVATVNVHRDDKGCWAVVDLAATTARAGEGLTCRFLAANGSTLAPSFWVRVLEPAAYRELQSVRVGLTKTEVPEMFRALLLLLGERYRAAGAPGYALAAFLKLQRQPGMSKADRAVVDARVVELEQAVREGP